MTRTMSGSRFPVGAFVACRVGISSGEGDTLKQTRENENRKDAIRTFDAIYKNAINAKLCREIGI